MKTLLWSSDEKEQHGICAGEVRTVMNTLFQDRLSGSELWSVCEEADSWV